MMQPITSGRVGLAVAPDSVQLAPGSQITIVLTVTNQGPVVDQFGLVVEGLDPTWFTVRVGLVNLFPSGVGTMDGRSFALRSRTRCSRRSASRTIRCIARISSPRCSG